VPYEGESDRELAARFVAGDVEAFSVLHRRHYARIYRLAYMQSNNADDAEDIASETFCRAFQHLRQVHFERGDSLYPWLHRIAANLCVDLCRDRSAHQMVSLDAESASGLRSLIDTLDSDKPSPFELLEKQEVMATVRSAIASLVPDQRDAIAYRFIGDLSLKEMTEAMHRSEGAVKSLLHRGLQNLRKEILKRVDASDRMQLLGRGGESANVRGEDIQIRRRTD
jgi:RNA polymerase sigma-70 factor, ECF subfamily